MKHLQQHSHGLLTCCVPFFPLSVSWEVVEKSVFTAGPEDALRVCNYRGVRVGINICYDIELPECSRVLALDGCQLLLVPTALAKGIKHELVPTKVVNCRAIDNHVRRNSARQNEACL